MKMKMKMKTCRLRLYILYSSSRDHLPFVTEQTVCFLFIHDCVVSRTLLHAHVFLYFIAVRASDVGGVHTSVHAISQLFVFSFMNHQPTTPSYFAFMHDNPTPLPPLPLPVCRSVISPISISKWMIFSIQFVVLRAPSTNIRAPLARGLICNRYRQ